MTRATRFDVNECSEPFVGQWQRLVSMTNWEKGRIICQWRDALVAAGVVAAEYSDEAWSRRISGVSSQHVGRLRRVYRRFAAVYSDYEGLYWSHFNAALDWHDAEMWLEGAVQSGWSISQLKQERQRTLGGMEGDDQRVVDPDDHAAESEWQPPTRTVPSDPVEVRQPGSSSASVDAARRGGRRANDAQGRTKQEKSTSVDAAPQCVLTASESSGARQPSRAKHRPFAEIGPLPADLAEAMEAFKLAILHHKMAGWVEVASDRVLAALDALKELVRASADGSQRSAESTA
jgi:hypothetical protein